ncbi:MAG: hypothetical protein JW901_06615 [Dehalococcoidia bacterium]|nr:hypothetical protein [Dehalococcoidia bacterium]
MSMKPRPLILKSMAVIFSFMIFCFLLPETSLAVDPPKGTLTIAQITVDPLTATQGESVNVTIKCPYSAPVVADWPQWVCLVGILVYDQQGNLVYGDLSDKQSWEGYQRGEPELCCSEEGASGTFTEQFAMSTGKLNPGTHAFNLEIYGSQRASGLGQPYWTTHHFSAKKSFTLTVQQPAAPPPPPAEPVQPPASSNQSPVASFAITPFNPTTADTIETNNTSFDPDGDALSYEWYIDGALISSSTDWYFENPDAGSYTIELVVADGRGGTDTQTKTVVVGSPQATTQPVAAQMAVYAKPAYFHDLGDEVALTVEITDAGGAPVSGESVQVSSLDPPGTPVGEYTDSSGQARFVLTHISDQVKVYSYVARAAGMERQFQIPVTKADIRIENNPMRNQPFQGVVADGASSLSILIDIPHLSGGEITFTSPRAGTLEGNAISFRGHLLLDKDGHAEITYRPPPYLQDKNELTVMKPLHGETGYPAWGMTEEMVFYYKNPSGQEENVPVTIEVFRPPVMLVHGFIGDKTTWANLAKYLAAEKFDPVVKEYVDYYSPPLDPASIEALSILLQQYIYGQKQDYRFSNIKITKVDVVAHSMGGLISRYYVEEMSSYENDVRKIIMAGTPNHGVSWLRATIGERMAVSSRVHQAASEQLYAGSEFIRNLNRGEESGRHLNMTVEYGNIIGRRTSLLRYVPFLGFEYEFDDAVVPLNSTVQNCVVSRLYMGVVHTTAIPMDVAMTEHGEIWGQIRTWLLEEIFRPPCSGSGMQIDRGEGEVAIQPVSGAWQSITSYPAQIQPWYGIRTGQGRATVSLTMNDVLWGTVKLDGNTELIFDYTSPDLVRVLLKKGSARFRSVKLDKSGHFDVYMGKEGYKWYQFQPRARVRGLGTDFIVWVGDTVQAYVLDGQVGVVSYLPEAEGTAVGLSPQQGTIITASGEFEKMEATPPAWWEDEFYSEVQNAGSPSDGGKSDSSCFIATAAYGSEIASQLDTFRAFRDNALMKNKPGRWFVSTYYSLSPPVADFIAGREELRTVVREAMLNPVLTLLTGTRFIWDN